ncbi:DUF2827 domain-containing protein [Burkholderia vietnamiensis]|uniref:DUF2827 domain-containing protein n=1 Tax=Burkholderia vietnamiensis TaxID=60552 RepID=UPI002ED3248D
MTLFLRDGQQSIWENGIFQNTFFLILLLQKSPIVEMAYLVNGGDGRAEDAAGMLEFAPAPVLNMREAHDQLDVIIELSAQLDPEWVRSFKMRGGRVVAMHVANDYVIDIERMMFNRPPGMLMSGCAYDAVWTLPQHERTCKQYYEKALRAPVTVMQHLWSPVLLERSLEASGRKDQFGYVAGRARWRLGIFEPNICMVKTSHLAMLLADVAYRGAPKSFEFLRVFNAMQLKEHPVFVGFARSLDMVRHGIATFEPRMAIHEVLSRVVDAVISHQWENGQNYLYYEALYGGYPLIHNSVYLDGCGYFYPEFDCIEGGLALRQAFLEHDASLEGYRRQAGVFLEKLNPLAHANVESYSLAISQVVNGQVPCLAE